jgi:hypothetical protein
MNDTTRQVGGALGVAVLGSVFTSAYTSALGGVLSALPARVAGKVTSSVGAALGVAQSIGGTAGRGLASAAVDSFIHAMSRALVIGAFVAILGAAISLIWLPNRAEPDAEELRRIAALDAEAAHHGEERGELAAAEAVES